MITFLLTSWFYKGQISRVSLVPPPPAEAKRERLVKLRQFVDQMWNEANYGELSALSRDAITFRNGYDGDSPGTVGFSSADNLDEMVEATQDELATYAEQCGEDLNRKSKNWTYCENVASFYLMPSLESLSHALRGRIDAK